MGQPTTVGVRQTTRSTKGLVDLGHYSPLKNLKKWAAAIIYISYTNFGKLKGYAESRNTYCTYYFIQVEKQT